MIVVNWWLDIFCDCNGMVTEWMYYVIGIKTNVCIKTITNYTLVESKVYIINELCCEEHLKVQGRINSWNVLMECIVCLKYIPNVCSRTYTNKIPSLYQTKQLLVRVNNGIFVWVEKYTLPIYVYWIIVIFKGT